MTEALEPELARLRAELAGVRDVLAQRDRAIVAAHRAVEIAQADNVVLRLAWEEMIPASLDGMSYDAIMRYRAEALRPEAGAALLAELDAARALADSVTAFFNKRGWSHAIMIGNGDILAMSEALSNYGAVEQRKVSGE